MLQSVITQNILKKFAPLTIELKGYVHFCSRVNKDKIAETDKSVLFNEFYKLDQVSVW